MAPRRAAIQTAAVVLGLLPLAALGVRAAGDHLGADPVETLTHETGEWALRLLLASLAVTPARRWLGWAWAAPLRRTLGLLAFTYASLHLLVWVVLDQFFDPRAMLEDVIERRYVTAGMTAWLLMLPLALTSTRAAQRRLGRRWQTLHRAVYASAAAAVVHFLWLVKADLAEPLVYAAVLAILLGLRLRRPARRGASVAR